MSIPRGFEVLKPYFLQALEKKYVPSLAEFIRLNVDFVAGSPPATTDVTGLTGIWTKRFATAASLLGIENGSVVPCPSNGGGSFGSVFALTTIVKDKPDWSPVVERRLMVGFKSSFDLFALVIKIGILQNEIASNRRKKTLIMYTNETNYVGDRLLEDQLKETGKNEITSNVESIDEGILSPCEVVLKVHKQIWTKRSEPEIDDGTDTSKVCELASEQSSMKVFTKGREMSNVFLNKNDLPCKREDGEDTEINEDDVDLTELHQPHITRSSSGKAMTLDEWAAVRLLVEKYNTKIPKTQCLYNPLFYSIIDHSGQHGPTTKLLEQYLPSMQRSLPDVNFTIPKLSDELNEFFDKLLEEKDLQDVHASTPEQQTVKTLFDRIYDSINGPDRDDLSEYEHIMRNLAPFVDALIRKAPNYRACYFENTTAAHCNKGGDPTDQTWIGLKVDVLVKFLGLYWRPDIGCIEVSGGLPRCNLAKEWIDTLKLGREMCDIWLLAQDQLKGIDASSLVVWGSTVVAHTIRIYALAAVGGFFHLILAYETPIPSSIWDMCYIKIAYCTMLGFVQKLDTTKLKLIELTKERAKLLYSYSGVKRKDSPVSLATPLQKRSKTETK
ncbi:8196_t:CDS:2 [Paraglomus brasilianum]|uniref:8196_t:CDS:1 n=1 Tax=Paraglomus brasilianum TaxID=144538 RepID=A0A9N9CWQ4_9GLOM|nr:8196_t:CDS:2 [Paraglomus brasilianum]